MNYCFVLSVMPLCVVSKSTYQQVLNAQTLFHFWKTNKYQKQDYKNGLESDMGN